VFERGSVHGGSSGLLGRVWRGLKVGGKGLRRTKVDAGEG
jgi:hypothetical protein